jgi:hypothetical protein
MIHPAAIEPLPESSFEPTERGRMGQLPAFRASRWISLAASALAIVAAMSLVLFLLDAREASRDTGAVSAETIYLADVDGKHERNVVTVFRNTTGRTVRLVGANDRCGRGGCVAVQGLPTEVGPGSELSLVLHYRPIGVGRFSIELMIYTDLPSSPTVPLRIDGNILGARSE